MNVSRVVFAFLSMVALLECASVTSVASQTTQSTDGCTCTAIVQRSWTAPENVYKEDGQLSNSVLGAGQYSTRLELKFDFQELPTDATITGVEVAWRRYASTGGCRDDSMSLIVGNAVNLTSDYCRRRNCNTDWNVNTARTDRFGGPDDLWGINLSPDDVRNTNFGVALRTVRNGGGGGARTFFLDSVNMTVHYTSEGEENAAARKKAGNIAAAVVVPILVVALAAGAVVAFFLVKKRRPEVIENLKNRVKSTIEPKPDVANIDVEKVEDKPYSKQETTRIGSEKESTKTEPANSPLATSASPKRPARPTSVMRGSERPGESKEAPSVEPYKPTPTGPAYIPSPTNGDQYKPAPTNRDSSFTSEQGRGSALGSSWDGRSSIMSSSMAQELPAVGKYQKSGKNAFSETLVFGAPIDLVRTKNGVPVAVEDTIAYLEQKGYQEEGILRLAGGSQEIKAIKETYDKGQQPDFSRSYDCHSISGALKLYFRDLPQRPLLMTKGIKQASTATDEFVDIMQKEFENIPEVNYFTIKRLFVFLNLVASSSHVNRMTPDNLAIVFQPTLQLPKPLIIALINHPEVFVK